MSLRVFFSYRLGLYKMKLEELPFDLSFKKFWFLVYIVKTGGSISSYLDHIPRTSSLYAEWVEGQNSHLSLHICSIFFFYYCQTNYLKSPWLNTMLHYFLKSMFRNLGSLLLILLGSLTWLQSSVRIEGLKRHIHSWQLVQAVSWASWFTT